MCVCVWVGGSINIYINYTLHHLLSSVCVCVFFPFLVNTFKEASHSHSHSHIQPILTN